MAISRSLMNRELQANGGIMDVSPREKFGLGSSLKKFVRKIIPNEVAEVAVKAAPFVAPFNPALAAAMGGLGSFDQTGRIGSSLKSGALTYGLGQGARFLGGAGLQGNPFEAPLFSSPLGNVSGFKLGRDVPQSTYVDDLTVEGVAGGDVVTAIDKTTVSNDPGFLKNLFDGISNQDYQKVGKTILDGSKKFGKAMFTNKDGSIDKAAVLGAAAFATSYAEARALANQAGVDITEEEYDEATKAEKQAEYAGYLSNFFGGKKEGGRIGFNEGADLEQKLKDLADYYMERGLSESEAYETAAKELYKADGGRIGFDEGGGLGFKTNNALNQKSLDLFGVLFNFLDDKQKKTVTERVGNAKGGRIGFEKGSNKNLVGIETLSLGEFDPEGFKDRDKFNTLTFGSDDLKALSQALDYGDLSDLSDRQKEKIREKILLARAGIIDSTEFEKEIGIKLNEAQKKFLKTVTPDKTINKIFLDEEGDFRKGIQLGRKLGEDAFFFGQKNPTLTSMDYNKLGDEYIKEQKEAIQDRIDFNQENNRRNFLNFKMGGEVLADGGRIGLKRGTDPEEAEIGIMTIDVEAGDDEDMEDMDDMLMAYSDAVFTRDEKSRLFRALGDPKIRQTSSSFKNLHKILKNPGMFPDDELILKGFLKMGKAKGGRIKYASGANRVSELLILRDEKIAKGEDVTDIEAEIFQLTGKEFKSVGGISNVPTGKIRKNSAGVKERDYRDEGGFVPVGIKEKADDVPAMLSKNEFVITADAVRGIGGGDVEKGSKKLYNLMKNAEQVGKA